MALILEEFEKDIIVDEAIITNKSDYFNYGLDLIKVKSILNYYIEDVLGNKVNMDIDFNTALGSTLNIGKLLIVAAKKDHNSVKNINSVSLSNKKILTKLADILNENGINVYDEVSGVDVFSVVPEFVMDELSYVKLSLMQDNREKLENASVNLHKINRVLEMFLHRYAHELDGREKMIGLIDMNGLYSLGNRFIHFILEIIEMEKNGVIDSSHANSQGVRLSEILNRKNSKTIDIYSIIMGIQVVRNFCDLTIRQQLDVAASYRWVPQEIRELEKISDRVFSLAVMTYEKGKSENVEENTNLKNRTLKNVYFIRDLIEEEQHEDNVGMGLHFTCEDSLLRANKVISEIEKDLGFICGNTDMVSNRMIKFINKK